MPLKPAKIDPDAETVQGRHVNSIVIAIIAYVLLTTAFPSDLFSTFSSVAPAKTVAGTPELAPQNAPQSVVVPRIPNWEPKAPAETNQHQRPSQASPKRPTSVDSAVWQMAFFNYAIVALIFWWRMRQSFAGLRTLLEKIWTALKAAFGKNLQSAAKVKPSAPGLLAAKPQYARANSPSPTKTVVKGSIWGRRFASSQPSVVSRR